MKIRRLIEWSIALLFIIAVGLILSVMFQPHIHKSRASDERKVYFCFQILSSAAFQYILEKDAESASYEDLSEYVTIPLPETGKYEINWEEFTVSKGQEDIIMVAQDGTVFTYNGEYRTFSHSPKAEPGELVNASSAAGLSESHLHD